MGATPLEQQGRTVQGRKESLVGTRRLPVKAGTLLMRKTVLGSDSQLGSILGTSALNLI